MELIEVLGLSLDTYLSNRTQVIKIEDVASEEQFEYGVPQSCILGPTMFLIYMNDLCKMRLSSCDIWTYTDDTALLIYGKSWLEAG